MDGMEYGKDVIRVGTVWVRARESTGTRVPLYTDTVPACHSLRNRDVMGLEGPFWISHVDVSAGAGAARIECGPRWTA
jgi:hypothetical protein